MTTDRYTQRREGERTSAYLARELMHAGLHELSFRAATGEFDDYGTVHVCGPTALHAELVARGRTDLATRVAAGEFDATGEESDEWAASPEGQAALASLMNRTS